jgi:hypothetical protein
VYIVALQLKIINGFEKYKELNISFLNAIESMVAWTNVATLLLELQVKVIN